MPRQAHGGRRSRGASRHWWLVVLAALAIAVALAPAAQAARRTAQQPSNTALQAEGDRLSSGDPSINLMQALLESFGIPATQQFITDNARADVSQDLFSPYGSKVKNQPAGIDLQATLTTMVHIPTEGIEPWYTTYGPCAGSHFVCAGNAPTWGDYYGYEVATRGPLAPSPGAYVEVGVSGFTTSNPDGKPPVRWKPGSFAPKDIYKGANIAWSFKLDHSSNRNKVVASATRQFYGQGQASFVTEPSNAFMLLDESAAMVFIPYDEWAGVTEMRIFAFRGTARQALADTYPDITEPATPYYAAGGPSLVVGETPAASSTPAASVSETPAPTASEAVPVVTEGASAAPSPTEVAVVGPPGPSPGPTPPGAIAVSTSSGGIDLYGLILLRASGLFLLLLGGFLVLRPGKTAPAPVPAAVGGGQPAAGGGVAAGFPLAAFESDPCPELARQLAIARHACEEARAAAAAAQTKADTARAAATNARTAARHALHERQRQARLVSALEQPPDPGSDSVSSHGETLTEYDLQLRAENDAAANAWYQDARASAVTAGADAAALQQLADEWGTRLNTPIADLRSRDATQRAQRLAQARADLQAAQAAEQKADTKAQQAEQNAEQADAAAGEARRRADQACAQVDRAERDHAACVEKKKAAAAAAAEAARRKREATPPPAPTSAPAEAPPPVPSGKPCPPPDEEWRHERSAGHFVVPVEGARITWTAEPSLRGLDEWISGQAWDGPAPDDQDPDEPVERQDASVSRAQFKTLNPAVIRRRFSDLAHPSQPIELHMRVTIPIHTVYVDCERKWECRGGHLVRTSHTRTVLRDETAPAHAGTWDFHMTAPQPNDVGRFIIQVQRALAHLEKSEYDFDNARLSCSE